MPKIHLIYKTHLDLGFTGYASTVRRQYHEHYIPMALDTGEHFLKENPTNPSFRWTTGSWLIWDHLNTQSPEKVKRLENGIRDGIISWHGLPFTTHTELLSRPLFAEALSLSAELDTRFGRRTRAAKMTDVPGHTLGAVDVMAEHGIEFLHLGVNAASPVPDVPPLFRWRTPKGSEIVVLYQSSYGEKFLAAGTQDAIAFAHTMDNIGPQSVGHVIETLDRMKEENPDYDIQASTLDTYWNGLRDIRDTLPIVTQEIGDTWIQGTGSAPRRLSRFFACQRAYDRFSTHLTPERRAFGRKLLEVAEHTWGVDIKTYLRDETAWDRADFETARRDDPRFQITEGAWAEQDRIIDTALALLDPADKAAICEAPPLQKLVGTPVAPGETLHFGNFAARIDQTTGALVTLMHRGAQILQARGDGAGVFAFTQRVYSADDIASYLDSYLTNRFRWGIQDHTKPGLATSRTQRSEVFRPCDAEAVIDGNSLMVMTRMPAVAVDDFGAPTQVVWVYEDRENALHVTLYLINKAPNRQPEAGFCHFEPEIDGATLRLEKMGALIDPMNVPPNGNRQLHSVHAVEAANAQASLRLTPFDVGLFSLSSLPFLKHTTDLPDLAKGGRFVLFNNKWGTNFTMWTGGDMTFRFKLEFDPKI